MDYSSAINTRSCAQVPLSLAPILVLASSTARSRAFCFDFYYRSAVFVLSNDKTDIARSLRRGLDSRYRRRRSIVLQGSVLGTAHREHRYRPGVCCLLLEILEMKAAVRRTKNKALYSIGHSNRDIDQFLELLKAHSVEKLVDIRTIPKSRHNPQFNEDKLRASLKKAGIGYQRLKELGGLRHPQKDSMNLGWENASFRGFADYMTTPGFAAGLEKLKRITQEDRTAVMCAEAVPWRCHRSLIADALVKQGWKVLHIQSRKTAREHKLTPFLRVRNGRIIYPKS